MRWIVFLGLIAWAVFGNTRRDVANWFWGSDAAPWESVDAFYYPNKNNLQRDSRAMGLKSIDDCRRWVNQQAAASGDPRLLSGSYECGVGFIENWHDMRVYRTTLR